MKDRVLRFNGEVDLSALDLATQAKVTSALAELERLQKAGHLEFATMRVTPYQRRKTRSDALGDGKAIQPQQRKVLEALKAYPEGITTDALAEVLGIPDSSARAQVNVLMTRGMVKVVKDVRPKLWGLASPVNGGLA